MRTLAAAAASALLLHACLGFRLPRHSWDAGAAPEMVVGIFSARGAAERRNAVRQTWQVPPEVTAKFLLCDRGAEDDGSSAQALVEESRSQGDMVFLDCAEGYGQGLLTKKVLAFFAEVRKTQNQTRLVYKVDDDTIVNLTKLMHDVSGAGKNIYAGVFEVGTEPHRDNSSVWYEPLEVFPGKRYPPAATGGPGYVLSYPLVDYILKRGIAERNMLWNEDRAVGVWVDLARKAGLEVRSVEVPGTQGYTKKGVNYKCKSTENATKGNFSLTMIHHVTTEEMLCFQSAMREDGRLGRCFCG